MKKNKMLRLASALLVMTLLTTCIIGGTFAKYVTTDSAQDAARVAKFGVVATIEGDLFGSTYKAGTDNSIMSYDVNGGTVSADAAADKVVAPGTQNMEGLTLTVNGTPEVSTKVLAGAAKDATNGKTYANSDIYLAKGKYGVMVRYEGAVANENIGKYYTKAADGKYVAATADATEVYELRDVVDFTTGSDYYPLTWYVNGGEVDNQGKVQDAIVAAFNGQAGNPNQAYNLEATVGWEWKFSDVGTGVISVKDLKDTILGKMIADNSAAEDVVCITADSIVAVTYKNEPAATNSTGAGSANNVINAYAGETKVACLTVSFNTSLTVEQVD